MTSPSFKTLARRRPKTRISGGEFRIHSNFLVEVLLEMRKAVLFQWQPIFSVIGPETFPRRKHSSHHPSLRQPAFHVCPKLGRHCENKLVIFSPLQRIERRVFLLTLGPAFECRG